MHDLAHEENISENVAFHESRKYAHEIVPSFSASVYFTLARNFARILSQALYRVRLVHFDKALVDIDSKKPFFCYKSMIKHGLCLDDLFGAAAVCAFLCS